jgi:hypothetical protein
MVEAAGQPDVVPGGTVHIAEPHGRRLTLFSLSCGAALPPLLVLQAGAPAGMVVGVALLMVLGWLPLAWRTRRLALIAEPRRLVIENFSTTHAIPWEEVASSGVARFGQNGSERQLAVVLTDGKVIRARATVVKPKDLDKVLDRWRPVAEAHGIPVEDLPARDRRSAPAVQPAGPAPGWYPDPEAPGGWRWWDGTGWGVRSGAYGPAPAAPGDGSGPADRPPSP